MHSYSSEQKKAYKIKIIGAGSAGNHVAHAASLKGWDVLLTDIDGDALVRSQNEIWPKRYGYWNKNIVLMDTPSASEITSDVLYIATPPTNHISYAVNNSRKHKIILIEKPLTSPGFWDIKKINQLLHNNSFGNIFGEADVLVNYNHLLDPNLYWIQQKIVKKIIGNVTSISVHWQESFETILAAHPWLNGNILGSYLGYRNLGGGSLSEHSHGLNMWQYLARISGAGRITQVKVESMDVNENRDSFNHVKLITEYGIEGDLTQDGYIIPADKSFLVQGVQDNIEYQFRNDRVRSEDFMNIINHLDWILNHGITCSADMSPLDLSWGIETMMVINAIWKSFWNNKATVTIDWSKGYVPDALSI